MALRFCDSFEHYAASQWGMKWNSGSPAAITMVTGRTGTGSAVQFGGPDGNTRGSLQWYSPDNQAKWVVGFAFNPSIPNCPIVSFYDGSTEQIALVIESGQLVVRRNWNGAYLGSGTTFCIQDGWQYIEMSVVINNTTGEVIVKKNGVTEISLTNQDTSNSNNAWANRLYIWSYAAAPLGYATYPNRFDDLYLLDGTGAVNNDFLGDCRVECIFPNGNGNSSQMLGSDGNSTDNYLLVDETAPNDDTDYVSSSTVGEKDTYAYSNLVAATGSVAGVRILSRARKQDSGFRRIVHVARLAGTEVDSSEFALADSYSPYFANVMETKPGGGAWSRTDVNSAEFGVKVTV